MYWALQVKKIHCAIIVEQQKKKIAFFIEIQVLFYELYMVSVYDETVLNNNTKIVVKLTFFFS